VNIEFDGLPNHCLAAAVSASSKASHCAGQDAILCGIGYVGDEHFFIEVCNLWNAFCGQSIRTTRLSMGGNNHQPDMPRRVATPGQGKIREYVYDSNSFFCMASFDGFLNGGGDVEYVYRSLRRSVGLPKRSRREGIFGFAVEDNNGRRRRE